MKLLNTLILAAAVFGHGDASDGHSHDEELESQTETAVVDLTLALFDEFVAENPLTLIEFFAPVFFN